MAKQFLPIVYPGLAEWEVVFPFSAAVARLLGEEKPAQGIEGFFGWGPER